MRVLVANHNGQGPDGGGGKVLYETVAGLRALGVYVESTTEASPDVCGFDLVHAFNIWPTETSLPQMRHLGGAGIPVVWEPVFSNLHEFTWASQAIKLLSELTPDSRDWIEVLSAIEEGTLIIEGMSRWSPNGVSPDYLAAATEMYELASHVSVCSFHEIGSLARLASAVRTPFTVVPHGVAAEDFADAQADDFIERFGIEDFILCVGSVEPRKNQLLLIEAAHDMEYPIVLIGPVHPVDSAYLAVCQARGGESVRYLGQQPRRLVAAAYKAARVHALPSFAEGSALSTMEAAAAGCDIVTSNRGSEFEYYGALTCACDPLSTSSIRAAIEAAIGNPRGEELAAHMRRYPWSRTAEATLAAYRRTLQDEDRQAGSS